MAESIEAKKLEMTHEPGSKAKTEHHHLELEPVPPLRVGAIPAKAEDADCSSRSSTPAPTLPSTPAKSAKERSNVSVSGRTLPLPLGTANFLLHLYFSLEVKDV